MSARKWSPAIAALVVAVVFGQSGLAQTPIKLPKNNFTPQQDAEIGAKGAAEIRQQYPIIKDQAISRYLAALGDRLVAVAPADLNRPEYRYSFTPVNLKEINAFALPGGPMFVHRGMFDAAAGEGEVVGVMAHELAHVLLRHGTANATKAQNPWLQLGQIAGQIGGAVVGGGAGAAIAEGSQFGLGTLLLRYSRDFEKQADLLGAQIMSKAGYDPRDLGRMFETIAREAKSSGGGGSPQWMSSHPDPGNRSGYIAKEAAWLTVAAKADTSQFEPTRARFAALGPATTMAEMAKRGEPGGSAPKSVGTPGKPVPAPSAQFRDVSAGKIFQASVPSNWTPIQSSNAVKFVPENGYGDMNGQAVFTHGVEFGIAKASSRDLKEATNTWLKAIAQSNPDLRLAGEQQFLKMSTRTALGTALTNPSPLGGLERIALYTTFLADGNLFYYLTLVPEKEWDAYQQTFVKIGQSIRLTDVR
jgi:beta-barrel assembly-enhancing protease